MAIAILLAGCARPTASSECSSFAACLFDGDSTGPLSIVVHASPGHDVADHALTVLEAQLDDLAGRGSRVVRAPDLEPLPAEATLGDLRALHDADHRGDLHLYVAATTYLVGPEPASGLSFPGRGAVFLFPATLDFRVEQANLTGADRAAARAALEAIVLVHEFGHALGLVGCGADMVRPHGAGTPCHSANPASIMHERVARVSEWPAWEWEAPLGPFAWDAEDLADVDALRSRLRDL